MFNIDTILKTLNSFNINSHRYGPTLYNKNDKLGICVDIKDSIFGFLTRIFTFNNNEELEEFLKKYTWYKTNGDKYNIDLVLDNYEVEEPLVKYMYHNEELSLEEMLNFEDTIKNKNHDLIENSERNIYLTNIKELTHYLIDVKRKNIQNRNDKNTLKIQENDLKFELIKALADYYGQTKVLEKKAVSLDTVLPSNELELLESKLKEIDSKSNEELKTYLQELIDACKLEETNEKNFVNVYSNTIYRYNIEILHKQIDFVNNKIKSEKNFNAKGSNLHNIDAELKSFLKNDVVPTKLDVYIKENLDIINNKYNKITDIKNAYSIISNNKLAVLNEIKTETFNKEYIINDLNNKFNNLDKKSQAYLTLYNSFYKNIVNYIIDNNYPNISDIISNIDMDYYYDYFNELIYNENNSHYLVNYFSYIDFKNKDNFISSLIDISKTVENTKFNTVGDLRLFSLNESSKYKCFMINPILSSVIKPYLVTINPLQNILFIKDKIELNEEEKIFNLSPANNIYIKADITNNNNIIKVNKYDKINTNYNKSGVIITNDLKLNYTGVFYTGIIREDNHE